MVDFARHVERQHLKWNQLGGEGRRTIMRTKTFHGGRLLPPETVGLAVGKRAMLRKRVNKFTNTFQQRYSNTKTRKTATGGFQRL